MVSDFRTLSDFIAQLLGTSIDLVDIPFSVIFHALSRGGRLSCVSAMPLRSYSRKSAEISYQILS